MKTSMPSGTARRIVLWLAALWGITFALAFLAPTLISPSGDGFTRGLNRLGPFFALQGLALLLALSATIQTLRHRRQLRLWTRLSGLAPLLFSVLLWCALIGVYTYAMHDKPAPETPTPRKLPTGLQ